MAIRLCEREVLIKAPISDVFDFFSDASNLARLTPPWVKFKILTEPPIEMKVGALIDYKISLRGIPMTWRTEITEWESQTKFVDRQLKGPYRQWIHTHSFEATPEGVMMRDRVEYVLPGGIFEPLIYPLVRKDVERIFDYRTRIIQEMFGS